MGRTRSLVRAAEGGVAAVARDQEGEVRQYQLPEHGPLASKQFRSLVDEVQRGADDDCHDERSPQRGWSNAAVSSAPLAAFPGLTRKIPVYELVPEEAGDWAMHWA